ncbi:DUF3788 family protein [Fusobacterium sp. PH5-44]|uniref:DUF3788 family protein n=1 Tax=unclassified Fusobacterium TaxID=2648384 RepID=UPI003D1C0DF1
MNNPQQLLRDESIKPNAEIIANGLGETTAVYIKFIEELKKHSIFLMDWRYYNDGKAWLSKGEYKWTTTRGTNKVKPIFWLSIWNGFFKVSFSFSEKMLPELLSLPFSTNVKEIVMTAKETGKTMKFISIILDITKDSQLNDVYLLAEFRKKI